MRYYFRDDFEFVCFSYKRKGRSSLGLDPRRQGLSWEDAGSNKKQNGGDKKKAADRYFSRVSQQLLRSVPRVPILPTIPESSDAISRTSFLPFGDDESKGGETGERFSYNRQKRQTLQGQKNLAKGRPGSSVGRVGAQYTEAVSSLQRPWVHLHPVSLCCMSSSSLSPVSCPLCCSVKNKGTKAPQNI